MLDSVFVDKKSITTLGLPKVLDRVADLAAFSASKDLARALTPGTAYEEVQLRQTQTTEARYLLSVDADISIGGAHDMRSAAVSAARGSVLEPAQLLDVKSTLISARVMKRSLEKSHAVAPALADIASQMQLAPGLVDAISKTLDPRGEVLDSASPKLSSIRRDLNVVHERLTTRLQRMVSDPNIAQMLQEPIVTQRDGRFVIPLRAEFKGRIKAVVHDQSSSGATLFIEPLTVVDLNNQRRELQLAERDEVRRILAALSAQVGEHAEEIQATVSCLAEIDLAFAKAKYSDQIDGCEPILAPWREMHAGGHPGSTMKLLAARHPLLDPSEVVPIDLQLDDETFALVITGPNTGGKTVALKTAGLLVLMAQCGLHIPATSGSSLSIFDKVFADIGDEQSIEQSLSTFSAHISNIIRILSKAGDKSLVLLDELGAGTDPQEGAALARALMIEFLQRPTTTLIATHYPEMKTFAHVTPGVRNASVEFDLQSLQPTYHLTIGLPGRSNALAIASRLGLGDGIIARAREWVAPEELQAESLLDEIHRQRDQARQERQQAHESRQDVDALREELRERLEQIEDERQTVLTQARDEAQLEVEAVQQELNSLRRRLKAASQPLEALKAVEEQIESLEQVVHKPVIRVESSEPVEPLVLKLGEEVLIQTLDTKGVITGLGEQEAEVQIGRLRLRARLEELAPVRNAAPSKKKHQPMQVIPPPQSAPAPRAPQPPPLELDLRGQRVDEALDELDRRLDAAFLTGMPFVRIIHGKGTGRLRQAVREALSNNQYVASFEPGHPGEGGDGVTIVRLALE